MAAKKTVKSKVEPKTAAKSLADFRAVHDKSYVIPSKIKEGIARLGKAGWSYENEFIALCGVSQTDFSRFREEFEDFYVILNARTGKRVWAGSKATADQMREML